MKNTLRNLALLVMFSSLVAMPINANTVDNTLNFTGQFSVINPCNNENSGLFPIDIYIVVSTAETPNGTTRVNVHHNSHASFVGSLGNEYQLNRRAKGQFDALSNTYVIEWWAEVIGKGAAPNFNAFGTLRVFTNAQNEPIGSNLASITTTCQ